MNEENLRVAKNSRPQAVFSYTLQENARDELKNCKKGLQSLSISGRIRAF
jgi:hypothetical protein